MPTNPVDYRSPAPRPPEGRLDLSLMWGEVSSPLEIDIGFGRGLSLFERLERNPLVRLLGIEIKAKWAYKCEQRRQRKGSSQLKIWAGDAVEILARAEPDGCVDRVSIHFPDPWWKKRHAKRRVVDEPLLNEVWRLLGPKGQLFIQTDVLDRSELYRQCIAEHCGFRLEGQNGLVSENPTGARSNREVRAEQAGMPIWRILAVKRNLSRRNRS